MIHCVETLLKSVILRIGKFAAGHPDDGSFYRDIEELEQLSLQHVTLNSDLQFFDEINQILNVITTVILHPHILNARETVIVRAEQAHGITPEMFFDTVRDEKLWQDKDGVMTPAEVYYFQNVDDLANYENRFIVHLIDIISRQVGEYSKFYDFLVGTLAQGERLTQESSMLEKVYARIETLGKKLRRIQRTEFYRIVSKANTHFLRVEPTNIFKHNRAYGACYRFYLKIVTYGDELARANDMATYYFTRFLVGLHQLGYILVGGGNRGNGPIVRPMTFRSEAFTIALKGAAKYGGMFIDITPNGYSVEGAHNLLLFDSTINFEEIKENLAELNRSDATAIDAITLWDTASVEGGQIRSNDSGGITENALIRRYLEGKTRLKQASRRIYASHCPSCGSKDVGATGDSSYHCSVCKTDYAFLGDNIWLSKLRKL